MGWTSYHANYYKNNGDIDRKRECDAYFEEGLNKGFYKIVRSTIKGSVYYAAVKALMKMSGENYVEIPESEQKVFAVVFLTKTDKNDYFNFAYKDMDESMGPCYYDCPVSILNLLSETDSEYANSWRNKCRENNNKKNSPNSLSKLPVGTSIKFTFNGKETIATKHEPAYQFKTTFWMLPSGNYIPKKYIPENYEVLS